MEAVVHGFGDTVRRIGGAIGRERLLTWALLDQCVVSAANFLTTVVVARALGVEAFGHYALSWAAILFVQSLLTALVIHPMMSILPKLEGAEEHAYVPGFVALAMAVSAGLPLVAVPAILLLLSATISASLLALLVPMVLASIAMLVHEVFRRLAFAQGRPLLATASDVVRYGGLTASLLAGASLSGFDTAWVFWLQGAAGIAGVLICIGIAPRHGYRLANLMAVARRHWVSARWLLGSAGLSWVTANWLAFAVGTFVGASAVGGMRANEGLMGVFNALVQSLQNVVPVTAARQLHEHGRPGMLAYVNKASVVLFAGGLVVALGAAVVAGPLFEIAFGPEFTQYSGLLFWFCLIAAIVSVEVPVSAGLRALESTGAIFRAYLIATLWTIVAGTAAVVLFGLPGAVAVYLSAWALRVGIAYVVLRSAARSA